MAKIFYYLLLLSVSCHAFEGRETADTTTQQHHTIKLTSLLPSNVVCDSSSKADIERKSSLKVVHRHGPCFQPSDQDKANSSSISHAEILRQDESRVESIHFRLSKNFRRGSDIKETDATTVPAHDGSVVATGNYVVTVGLGTPKKDLSLVFDTGSDFTWTQCEPCVGHCYEQMEPTFDPRKSKTYRNISCSSSTCSSLISATSTSPRCASSTCVYGIQYGDNSFSVGFFAEETLTLTQTDVFPNFLFGCGQNNDGLFGKAAGLIGLGRDQLSLVSQTGKKYNKYFSYCLPSSPSYTGHLTFGNPSGFSKSLKFTPLSKQVEDPSFYGLDFVGISVGGKKLSIRASVFSTSGAIIDSGTVVTRLPPKAYTPLRTAFRRLMSKYPRAPALSILDTCYDFSKYDSIVVPPISFYFYGGIEVRIDVQGIFLASSEQQVCLAIAANDDDSDVAIFGNSQQKTLEVVYDVGGKRVGFAPGGCK